MNRNYILNLYYYHLTNIIMIYINILKLNMIIKIFEYRENSDLNSFDILESLSTSNIIKYYLKRQVR